MSKPNPANEVTPMFTQKGKEVSHFVNTCFYMEVHEVEAWLQNKANFVKLLFPVSPDILY